MFNIPPSFNITYTCTVNIATCIWSWLLHLLAHYEYFHLIDTTFKINSWELIKNNYKLSSDSGFSHTKCIFVIINWLACFESIIDRFLKNKILNKPIMVKIHGKHEFNRDVAFLTCTCTTAGH